MRNSKYFIICLASMLLSGFALSALGQVFDLATDQDRFGNPKPLSTSSAKPIPDDETASTNQQQDGGIRQVGWFPFTIPRVTMPKVALPQWNIPKMPPLWPTGKANEAGSSENTALLAPVATGANKIKEGTRRAWEGTRQMLTFGRGGQAATHRKSAPQPDTNKKPPMWKRLFAPAQPERNDPQTITEWMSQPRLDH